MTSLMIKYTASTAKLRMLWAGRPELNRLSIGSGVLTKRLVRTNIFRTSLKTRQKLVRVSTGVPVDAIDLNDPLFGSETYLPPIISLSHAIQRLGELGPSVLTMSRWILSFLVSSGTHNPSLRGARRARIQQVVTGSQVCSNSAELPTQRPGSARKPSTDTLPRTYRPLPLSHTLDRDFDRGCVGGLAEERN
jgi:hypothetical protein